MNNCLFLDRHGRHTGLLHRQEIRSAQSQTHRQLLGQTRRRLATASAVVGSKSQFFKSIKMN